MNRNKKLFDLQLFTGTSITRSDAEALIPVQESHEIIQGVVEQSAVLSLDQDGLLHAVEYLLDLTISG